MPLRTVLLRVMLWSLAISAVTGVVAVLSQGGELVWRIIGTGFVTAAACGLMLPASRMIDQEKSRTAGLLGMAGVIIEFLLAVLLIWDLPGNLGIGRWEEKIALTMAFLALATVVAICLLQALHAPPTAIAARTGLCVVVAAFTAVELAVWLPRDPYYYSSHGFSDDWWSTGGVLALFGGLAAVSLIGLETGVRRNWRWAGIASGFVAAAMWLEHIWIGTGSDLGTVVFSVLLSIAVVVAHAILCLLHPLPVNQGWVPRTAIGAAMLAAALIVVLVIDDKLYRISIDHDVLGRLAAAAGIVASCGTLALTVLLRINRKVDFETLSTELLEITVVCPRCSKKQAIAVGGAICSGCKLRISIQVEEPRCPKCDYLLYRLESDRCPECGTPIAPDVCCE